MLAKLDLVLCEYSYRDAYTALKRCSALNDTKADVIDYRPLIVTAFEI
jgi:hypothetical protein